ncbi:MAG: hypothetical protein DI611_07785 [Brachybacterium faecium]|nr:MAG: hypothetical protein DI611_07785 [Brachybacterium faecium]PZT92616.1 MAG: hypothetical protein DI630_28230 [Gordonia sp. (in: high G+C Gram-positive bacteria)]
MHQCHATGPTGRDCRRKHPRGSRFRPPKQALETKGGTVETTSYASTEALARAIAERISDQLSTQPRSVFGWPSGRTTVPVIKALADVDIDLSGATFAMMDDYVLGSTDQPQVIPETAHYSCRHWVQSELFARLSPERSPTVIYPNPFAPERYEDEIASLGGIDTFIVGIGSSDGHVAFNPPGTRLEARTRVVQLANSTRIDNLQTFPEFESLSDVPQAGVTVGLATIADARRIVALAHGASKRTVIRQLLELTQFSPELPASFLHHHPHTELHTADLEAPRS